jgi:glyoxylase-like metal-dependent hydrolase (beta-lactamase superfamily II)
MPEVAEGIRRLGQSVVNSYLVEDGGSVVIVDAGVPAYWGDLQRELTSIGRTLEDVRAVVLTHGHSDHIGFAERARTSGMRLLVHELDAALARSEVPNPAKGLGSVRPLPLLQFLVFSAIRGALRIPKITEVGTFGDGVTLDVPGAPTVIHVPGHTPGSAALHFSKHDALFVGDAFSTYAVTTGRHGPQLAPFTADEAEALRSLDRLRDVPASLLLPGHGSPWREGPSSAIQKVRISAAA